jgi:hypothetical protein
MAITDNTVFTGRDAEGFYSQALLSGPSKSLLTLVPNVKSKIKLAGFDLGDILQDADCTFNGSGEGTLSQKSFEVCAIKINLEYCKRTFETNYLSQQLRAGSNNPEVMPQSMEEYLLDLTARKISADLETVVWQGNTTGATYPINVCDGLIFRFSADTNVIKPTGFALTLSNIISATTTVYNAIPTAVFTKPDVKIFMGVAAAKLYRQAIAAASSEAYYVGDKTLDFLGIEIIEAPGMPINTIVAGALSNMFLLTDLESDFEDVRIIPMIDTIGQPTVRLIGAFKFGVDYYYGSEIVYFRP